MMTLHAIHTVVDSPKDYVFEFVEIRFHKSTLERYSAFAAEIFAPLQIIIDILQLFFCVDAAHNLLINSGIDAVDAEFDIRNYIQKFVRPIFNTLGKCAVCGEVHFDVVFAAQVHKLLKMRIQQRFAHCRRNYLPEPVR